MGMILLTSWQISVMKMTLYCLTKKILPLSTFLNPKETDFGEEDHLPLSKFQNSDRNNFHGKKREKASKLDWIIGNDLKSRHDTYL